MMTTPLERNVAALAEVVPGLDEWMRHETPGTSGLSLRARPTSSLREIPVDVDVLLLGSEGISCLGDVLRRTRGRVALVEPDWFRLARLLELEDLGPDLLAGRLHVYPQPSFQDVVHHWKSPAAGEPLRRLVLVDGAGADGSRRGFFERVREGIVARERDLALDLGAVYALGPLVVDNLLANLASGPRPLPASLPSTFEGVPGIVAAAGPSLDRNCGVLREIAGRAVLIAVDTAVRPLARHGIAPQFVVAVDPRERNVGNLADTDLSRSYLIAEAAVHPDLLALGEGAAGTAVVVADNGLGKALETLGSEIPSLAMFGSVATAAFELAVTMGCDPIVFVGLDLAFTGGREYAENVAASARAKAPEDERRFERDVHGASVCTTLRLQSFRDWLEKRIWEEGKGRTFVNATGAGILKKGVVQASTLDALDEFLGGPISVDDRIREVFEEPSAGGSERRTARAVVELAADVRESLAILSRRADSFDQTLSRYLKRAPTVALVEILEARELTRLASRWRDLVPEERGPLLLGTLERGCRKLLVKLESAQSRARIPA
jgi:6-hydroxymethylpterin diphosphokinase MptE-like